MLLQVGAFDQKWEDCLKLLSGLESGDLLAWALKQAPVLTLKQVHKLADGTPHLAEYEGTVVV